jgi:hypothetical protein
MIQLDYDAPGRCLFIRLLSSPSSEKEWEQGLAGLLELDTEAHRQGKDGILFVVIESGAERPNATWRRRLAEQRKKYQAKARLLVMITDSLLFRGMLTAIDWLVPSPPEEKTIVTASLEDGIAQAETWRREEIPFLKRLLVNAQEAQ